MYSDTPGGSQNLYTLLLWQRSWGFTQKNGEFKRVIDHNQKSKESRTKMKLRIKNEITKMRIKGCCVKEIATTLNLSINTVKSHIYRHPELPGRNRCLQCGSYFSQPQGRKQKKFCSDKCRMNYWNHCYRGKENEK